MLKDRLKAIKTDMRDVRSSRADYQSEVKYHLWQLEIERRKRLAGGPACRVILSM